VNLKKTPRKKVYTPDGSGWQSPVRVAVAVLTVEGRSLARIWWSKMLDEAASRQTNQQIDCISL